jgi:hypothetical protein
MPHKTDTDTPDTYEIENDLISNGKVVEGYTLRYLRQIRDLLLNLESSSGWTLCKENNSLVVDENVEEKERNDKL